ncbi:response regulator transcription factor [Frankia sp. R82]|uniref:response regulator transcription factor n=1 Tax=Frankia sp. R82 TaxID=2950553 RepID=UPI00255B1CA5|nr:response regulator transcription factor [Frankia sp. R82]
MTGAGDAAPAATTRGASLLVAEDDEASRVALARSLERFGYRVLEAADGEAALRLFQTTEIDLVVLDVAMPRMDGFAVLSRLRQTSEVPVIMLTGRAEEVDRVVGLELGADDYVVKPYSLRELVARVRARLRRRPTEPPPQRAGDGNDPLIYGDVSIDLRAREVAVAGERIDLTAREYELLAFLARHPRRVFSREELLEQVWGTRFQDPATVTEHVRRVRTKVEGRPPQRRLVTTLRGMGYRFDP